MKVAIIALTEQGTKLALKLRSAFEAHVYLKEEFLPLKEEQIAGVFAISHGLRALVKEKFHSYDGFVFIMACGIVVRTIAPLIRSKTSDPAVVVMDERGQFVISLLSGHIGGANRMAAEVAEITGGVPVISTSTDVNGVISFDVFAIENHCKIENIENLKFISSQLVNGGSVRLYADYQIKTNSRENVEVIYELDEQIRDDCLVVLSNRTDLPIRGEKILYLRPRNLVLGIGCRRGTPKRLIQEAVMDFMAQNRKSMDSIRCLATVDLKKEEQGLLEYCEEMQLQLSIISRKEIEGIERNFTTSEFVKEKVGVASVAEPCSVLGSFGGRLICKKTRYKGITLALAEEDNVYCL